MAGELSLGIAIPSFNQRQFVRETLRSIRRIDVPFEAIIRDAGSTDGTLETIDEVVGRDDRFTLQVVEGEGQAEAINRAWGRLVDRHPMVTWMNTDDVYEAEAYTRLLRALAASDERTVMMFGDFHLIDESGRIVRTTRRPTRVYRSQLLHYPWNLVPGVGMAIRSSAVQRTGRLDEALHYVFDYEYWVRLAALGRIVKHPEVVVSFRWHGGGKTAGEADRSRQEHERVAAALRSPLVHPLLRPAWRAHALANRWAGRWE